LGKAVSAGITEADIEALAIDLFRSLGYDCASGAEIAPDGPRPLRDSVSEPALATTARAAIARLNPELPGAAVED
jgi:type I restriction enzyme R subunit